MENTEWLKSLSDRQLVDEIRYGRALAEGDRHREHHSRELREAIAEMKLRKGDE